MFLFPGLELYGVDLGLATEQFVSTALACSVTLILANLLQRQRDQERDDLQRRLNLNERIRDLNLRVVAEAIPQIVWRMRSDGGVDYFNSAWYGFTGLTPEESLEFGFYAAIHADDVARAKDAWQRASATGSLYEVEYLLRRNDGTYRWFLARATPLRNVDGEVYSWFGTCTDIDDQRRAREAVQKFAERAARVSDAFQVASLPESLPKVAGLHFDAVYEAGVAEALVGGDWYDAMRLLDGRILLSVGDVSGSGLAAAVTMNAMRQIIRGAAQNHADPPAILDAADRTLRMERPDGLVTAFVGILDPLTLTLHYACAGHPPPFLRRANGEVEELRALGLPLGLWEKDFSEGRVTALGPGSLLVMYTDGLTESRRDPSEGELRLLAAIASPDIHKIRSCAGAIRDAMLTDGTRDDVAILTLSVDGLVVGSDGSMLRRIVDPHDPLSVMRARDDVIGALRAHSTPERSVCDAELIFAELIGNVVRHAPGMTEVVLDASGRLPVLSFIDEGPGFSRAAHLPVDMMREGGRGLFIVSSLAKELNVTRRVGKGSHVRAVLEVGLLG